MAKEKITHLQAMGADVLTTRSDVEKGHPECEERRRVCARARACFCCSVRGQARLHYTHTPNPPNPPSPHTDYQDIAERLARESGGEGFFFACACVCARAHGAPSSDPKPARF